MSFTDPRPDADVDVLIPEDGGVPPTYTIGDVLARTWRIYRERPWNCIGLVLGCWGLNFLSQTLLSGAKQAAPHARNPEAFAAAVDVLGTLGAGLFQVWINVGQVIVLMAIARGWQASFGDVFSGGRYVLRVFFASLLFLGLIFGVLAPGMLLWEALGRNTPSGNLALGLSMAILVPAAIALAVRLSQYSYLIIDREAEISGSLKQSFQITRGGAWKIFLIALIALAIAFVAVLICLVVAGLLLTMATLAFSLGEPGADRVEGLMKLAIFIGLVFTAPFVLLSFVVNYLTMTGQPTALPSKDVDPGDVPGPP